MTSWKVAGALDQLLEQLNALAPHRSKASDGSIGDAAHAARDSDHDPWWVLAGQAYVTARDYSHDPAGGLDCQWLANALQAGHDQRVKYAIWNRRIMAGAGGPSPWTWRPYSGANAHQHHLHLSVVADARSLVRIPWQLNLTAAKTLEEEDLTPDQDQMLRAVYRELTLRLPNRRGPNGQEIPGGGADTALGYSANADGFLFQIYQHLAAGGGLVAGALSDEDLHRVADAVADEQARRLAG